MTSESNEPLGYLIFRKNTAAKHPAVLDFDLLDNLDSVEAWKAGPIGQPSPAAAAVEAAPPAVEVKAEAAIVDQMIALMRRIKLVLMGYHPLISLNNVLPNLVRMMLAQRRMTEMAKDSLALVSEDDQFAVYAVPRERVHEFGGAFEEINQLSAGYDVIPGSVMLSLVATFDSLMGELIRILLLAQPDRFARSDRVLSIKDILSMSSFDQVITKVIDDEIDQIMRGSHADQVRYVEANFKIQIRESYPRWSDFIEIFERRNLVAHGNCIANEIYIANCKNAGVDVEQVRKGDALQLTSAYLHKAVNILAEFALLSVVTIALKTQPKDRERIYREINSMAFDLIREKRSRVASWLLDFALHKQKPKVSDAMVKMMTVNYANSLKKLGDTKGCEDALRSMDWSAASDSYKISIAALRDDEEAFLKAMARVHRAGSVTSGDFHDWPVFDWVRDKPAVREEFERLYGEPLFSRKSPPADVFMRDETGENAGG